MTSKKSAVKIPGLFIGIMITDTYGTFTMNKARYANERTKPNHILADVQQPFGTRCVTGSTYH
jgi:hypothetical protein